MTNKEKIMKAITDAGTSMSQKQLSKAIYGDENKGSSLNLELRYMTGVELLRLKLPKNHNYYYILKENQHEIPVDAIPVDVLTDGLRYTKIKDYIHNHPKSTVKDIVENLGFKNAAEYIRLMINSGEIQKGENDTLSLRNIKNK